MAASISSNGASRCNICDCCKALSATHLRSPRWSRRCPSHPQGAASRVAQRRPDPLTTRQTPPLPTLNPQPALVEKPAAYLERPGEQLGDAALSANYNHTIAAISKYNAVGHDPALIRIDRLLTQLIRDERALLAQRNRIAAGDRASLNQAILLFSLLGAAAAVIAIGATFSLLRAESERRLARREQVAEIGRAHV